MKSLNFFKMGMHSRIFTPLAFCSVGLITTGIYFCIFAIFYEWLEVNYKIAVTAAYLLSVLFHFNSNRSITFKSAKGDLKTHLVKYILTTMLNYGIALSVVSFVVSIFHLSPYIGVMCSTIATAISGYIIFKLWVFREVKNAY